MNFYLDWLKHVWKISVNNFCDDASWLINLSYCRWLVKTSSHGPFVHILEACKQSLVLFLSLFCLLYFVRFCFFTSCLTFLYRYYLALVDIIVSNMMWFGCWALVERDWSLEQFSAISDIRHCKVCMIIGSVSISHLQLLILLLLLKLLFLFLHS